MDFFKNIDAYLDGELTGSELSNFLEELKHNTELAREVELYRNVNTLLEEKAADDSKRKDLKRLHADYMNSRNHGEKSRTKPGFVMKCKSKDKFYYAIAAGLSILIIVAGIYCFTKNNSNSDEKLFTAYYTPYEYSSATRSIGDNQNTNVDLFDMGLEQYENANYSTAIPFFENKLLKDTVAYGAEFFVGICYMETKQYNKALASFQKIIKVGSSSYSEAAHWYLALCYLKMENKQKALDEFNFMIQDSSYYMAKSKEILSKIEKQN